MVYLDYSATTPLDPRVAEAWFNSEKNFFANANSSHALGVLAKQENDRHLETLARIFHVLPNELILTSSAVEANNFAIKGLAMKYPDKRHVITSVYEHASLIAALASFGNSLEVETVNLKSDGTYDLAHLESLIRPDTLVVSLVAVDSETGLKQPVEAVGLLCHQLGVYFHCDATQAYGKTKISFDSMDLVSLSAHKIYGPKGVGMLIKKKSVGLVPLMHGGHSFTPFRASTPANSLLAAFTKAVELADEEFEDRYRKVSDLRAYLKAQLSEIPNILINSSELSIPQIFNVSILNTKPEEGVKYFSEHGIYLSSKSACSGEEDLSKSVLALTGDHARAISSYRISLSHLSTIEDMDHFVTWAKELATT